MLHQRQEQQRRQQEQQSTLLMTSHVKDGGDKVLISVDVPGVQKKDLVVSVEENVLTISGTRRFMTSSSDNRSRRGRTFEKHFLLQTNMVDRTGIGANLAHGVLVVTVPKKAKRERQLVVVTEEPHEFLDGNNNNNKDDGDGERYDDGDGGSSVATRETTVDS